MNFDKINIITPISQGWSTSALIANSAKKIGLSDLTIQYDRNYHTTFYLPHQRYKNSFTLIIKGDGIPTINSLPQPVVCWNFDFDKPPDKELVKAVDLYLTICPEFVTEPNMKWLPQATDLSFFHHIPNAKQLYDVSFIGSPKPPRPEIIKELRSKLNPIYSIIVRGEEWPQSIISESNWTKPAYYDTFNLIASQSKINLNFTQYSNFPTPSKTLSQRIFMLAACKSFIMCEKTPGLDYFFNCNENAELFPVDFNNITTLAKEVIPFYLKEDRHRRIIAERAYKKVLNYHLYEHRLLEMIKMINE